MSNFFTKATCNPDELQNKLIGPRYSYSDHIRPPQEIGMSGKGSAISANVHGLEAYVKLLFEGGGKASKAQGALGKQYFLVTGAKCKDKKSGQQVSRSLYINNIPSTKTALSSGMGMTFSKSSGLIPGILNDLESINPLGIFGAFMAGTNPDCIAITLPTRDANGTVGTDTKYLTVQDVKNMSPCLFPGNKNILTKKTGTNCIEGFQNISNESDDPFYDLDIFNDILNIKDNNLFKFSDIVAYVYFTSLIILFLSLVRVKGENPLKTP